MSDRQKLIAKLVCAYLTGGRNLGWSMTEMVDHCAKMADEILRRA